MENGQDFCEIGISDDCEDCVEVKCKKCNKDIIVNSQVTQVRFWTTKVRDGEQT